MTVILGCDVNCWQMISSISTIAASVATIFGIIAIFLTLRATKNQLNEMAKSRALSAFFEAFKLFEDDENWRLFKFVYNLSGKPG
jgi:hypothetical protein